METQLRKIAQKEHRTLSGVLQEAARYYINIRRWEDLQQQASLSASKVGLHTEDDVTDMIHDLRAQS